MNFFSLRRLPIFVTVGLLAITWMVQWLDLSFIRSLSNIGYDWRVRLAAGSSPCATNFAVVYIDEKTLQYLAHEPFEVKPPFPRQIHGRLLRELGRQGAKIVALDVLFGEENKNDSPLEMAVSQAEANGFTPAEIAANTNRFPVKVVGNDGQTHQEPGFLVESDDFFRVQMRKYRNTLLAADLAQGLIPPPIFRTNAYAIGDIAVEKDSDGSLRRLYAFRDSLIWNEILAQLAEQQACLLGKAKVEKGRCVFPKETGGEWIVPIDDAGQFEFKNVPGCPPQMTQLPPQKAFSKIRVWHMGIEIAARELGLDLNKADIDLKAGRIALTGPKGIRRLIPVDSEGRFLINWSLTYNDPRLLNITYGAVLVMDQPGGYEAMTKELHEVGIRWSGKYPFQDKLVVVGSRVIGSNMTDAGPTPLSRQTYFVSTHWNVANSIIMQQFVHACPPLAEAIILMLLAGYSALTTWRWRVWIASTGVVAMALLYIALAAVVYVKWRFVAPLELPVIGGLLATHGGLLACRVLVEQRERWRVRSVFSKLVSPNVVTELLGTEQLHFGGARREVTVFFADVRGFTEMTDLNQARAEEFVREHKLAGADADRFFDEQAREVLSTVNLYLSVIADMVKKHDGTLDKYIGDCVMAFWGAPTPNEKHAAGCVRAAIDAQRAMAEINMRRGEENTRREKENLERVAAGLPPLALLSVLSLGSGINSGLVTVGLMGSQDHILNYTVFGRDVNLASRLEAVSGRGRIIISDATYQLLKRDDPGLAALCVEQPPVMVKGFRQAIKIFEVPWKTAAIPG